MPTVRVVVLTLLTFIFSVHTLGAQALLGHVVDDDTGNSVAWAEVMLLDENGDTLATAVADSGGWFMLRWRGGGPLHVRASRLGYRPVMVGPLRVGPFESLTLEVRLGVTVMPSPTFGGAHIRMRGGHCAPAVYVQGMRESERGVLPVLDPHAIRGVEVYRGASEVPARWSRACGVVLIWLH